MLRQFNPAEHAPARITRVVELAPELKYPQRLVGVGPAHRHGEEGFVILDGPRSRWYATSELPPGGSDKQVVMVHVGRALLGFQGVADRRRYLEAPAVLRSARRSSRPLSPVERGGIQPGACAGASGIG